MQVLLKFLDFFSKFDWEKSCVSLRGPVAIASLPEMKGETDHPKNDSQEQPSVYTTHSGFAIEIGPSCWSKLGLNTSSAE